MTDGDGGVPVVIATLLREAGGTGVQTHVRELARHLGARQLPVAVVTPFSAGGVLRDAVFAVRRLLEPVSGTLDVLWYRELHRRFLRRALRRTLRHHGEAVVYCQCPVAALAALAARAGPHQKVVLAVHFCRSQADEWAGKGTIGAGGLAYRAIRRAERDAFDGVDALVYVSEAARRDLWLDPPGVPAVVVPNFVAAPAASGGGGEGRADLVTIGALEPNKNHTFLLDVLAVAALRGHRLTLDVIGEGPLRRALRAQARRLGVGGQVRFLGYVPDAPSLLSGYRAYVHAARSESFGLAVLEAMAAGIPVVAPPVGGVAELFTDGVEGRFWPLGDAERAADVLLAVLATEPERTGMGASARRRVLRDYDAAVACPRLHRFLLQALHPDGAAVAGPAVAMPAPAPPAWTPCGETVPARTAASRP